MKKVLFGAFVLALLQSCSNPDNAPENLARKHCASCHAFPEPSLLTKKVWEQGVLPEMAFRMGLDRSQLWRMNSADIPEVVNSLPARAMVTEAEWEAIKTYYTTQAPDSIRIENKAGAVTPLTQFSVSLHKLQGNADPFLTLVKFDSAAQKIYVGNRFSKLYRFNTKLVADDSFRLFSPPSDILTPRGQDPIVACMGIMDPNDQPGGRVVSLSIDNAFNLLIDSLKRPVHLEQADIDNDGQSDLIVSAFGNFTGGLYAFEKKDSGYQRHTVHRLPGTRKTVIADFNSDGRKDILALITQGDEQITLFINNGNFEFTPQILLRFPPVYGSSYVEVTDFNGDGQFDILYTNGDNADFSNIIKPYHGIRLFINEGNNVFKEHWFYPMPGASKAIAQDFDRDGDIDIAAISFFPDFANTPQYGFLYFHNDRGNFTAHTTPLAAGGRWLVLEAADIDNDTDADLLIGALNFPAGVPQPLLDEWQTKKHALLFLRNNIR